MDHNFTPAELAAFVFKTYYVDREIDEVLSYFTEDITWIGPCDHEYLIGHKAIKEYFQAGLHDIPSCHLQFTDLRTVQDNGLTAVVMGRFLVNTDMDAGMILEVKQRCSFFMERIAGKWMVRHLHNSNIYEDMHEDEYFPQTVGHQTVEYMNRLLKEKSEVIDMINDNINGGLKGSNDDDTYSYYYVNEGLCHMLGYTYDEFMEMSHGCAVGAVYPPDLPAALQSCEDCFAKGPTYRAEYRIQKKDGSLLWVLDSGKKCMGEDGKVKINSMITDITDIKEAQLKLQLERERYRIALDNITDVMFEYDILKDSLIKYERENYDRKNPIQKIKIDHYFTTLEREDYIHLDDIGILKAYMVGKYEAPFIEIRMYMEPDTWRWIRVTCSYLYDESHHPIRCIGIWSDITEEKMRIDSLIDLSKRDALTHLYNTKSSEMMIKEQMKNHTSGAMMILDIDYFKHVNDTFGHLKGNDILLEVTKVLNRFTNQEDIVSRIGGDEFLIYMSDDRSSMMMEIAQSILCEVHQIMLPNDIKVTLSMGIAYQKQQEDYAQLFKKADDAMYQAKKLGRNQIYCDRS